MPPAGLDPAIPASERPKTHALDSSATRIGFSYVHNSFKYWLKMAATLSKKHGSVTLLDSINMSIILAKKIGSQSIPPPLKG